MSYFRANLDLLAAKQPDLADHLRQAGHSRVKIASSACGLPTAIYKGDSTSTALHSRYNPLREAHQQLKKHDCAGADYFILLGFGLGYLLDALLEEFAHPSNHYFIVESDLEILRAAFEARDLAPILSRHNVYFAWPASGPELASQWQKHFDPVLAQKSVFLTHLPSMALNLGKYKAAAEMIQSQIFQTFTDINTLVAQSQTFLDNFVTNLPKAAKAPGVTSFAGLFANTPAILVSAGPSLDKNIHELRGFEDRVLILATDTALKPLLAAGIDPHFVLTGDPSHANYLHLKGASTKNALLVTEATSFPLVFDEFEGRTIACTYDQSALKSLSELLGNKGVLHAWGSVATLALDYALLLGCNPVIFIGQDLAHTDGRIYCSGVYFENDWFQGIVDPAGYYAKLAHLRSQRLSTMAEDIFGKPVESTDKLMAYWNWILKVIGDHPGVQFINATEGGILRGSVAIMSLKEALYRHCEKNLSLRTRTQDAFHRATGNNVVTIQDGLSLLQGELASLQKAMNQGIQICQPETGTSRQTLMKSLEEINSSIYFHKHLAPLVDSFNQMGNVTFLRKRHGIRQELQEANSVADIKSVYLEYYVSVREALSVIGKALSQIQADFHISDTSGTPETP